MDIVEKIHKEIINSIKKNGKEPSFVLIGMIEKEKLMQYVSYKNSFIFFEELKFIFGIEILTVDRKSFLKAVYE